MTDIVTRLRNWRTVHLARLHLLMEEAADEMERLSQAPCPHVVGTTTMHCSLTPFTLTEEEREAVERAADWLYRWQETHGYHSSENGDLATLRSLLERVSFIRDYPEPDNTASEDNESVRKTGGDFGQQPTITDEEREAIRRAAAVAREMHDTRLEAALGNLLERLG